MKNAHEPLITEAQDDALRVILSRIVERYAPLEVSLFGSRYRGDCSELSDWDLLVLVSDEAGDELFDPYLAWQISRDCGIHVDIVVETSEDFYGSVDVANSLAREIKNERRIIYRR